MVNMKDLMAYKVNVDSIKKQFNVSDFEAYMMVMELEKNDKLNSINLALREGLGIGGKDLTYLEAIAKSLGYYGGQNRTITEVLKDIETSIDNIFFDRNK